MAVARRGEVSIARLAKDFGISQSCLRNWLLLHALEPCLGRDQLSRQLVIELVSPI